VVQQLIKLGVSGQDILLNAGTSNASDSVRLIQEGQSLGVKHFMLMPPVMGTDSTDQGLVDFFKQTLSHLTGLEMGIYLSSPISPNVGDFNNRVINEILGKHPKFFRGLIDQSPNASHTLDWLRSFSNQLPVFTGHDMNAQVLAGMGIHTCVSAYANILTRMMVKSVKPRGNAQKMAVAGNKIDEDTSRLNEFDQWLSHLPLVPALKFVMSLHDHDPDWIRVRPTLSPLAGDAQEKLGKAFKKMSLHPNVF
jgi:dihydrodipicolinate synthase/N-acetylneuraminate lyase